MLLGQAARCNRYLNAGGGARCPFVFDVSSVMTVTNSPTAFPRSPEIEKEDFYHLFAFFNVVPETQNSHMLLNSQ
jgi:hypothetical protein